MSKGFKNAHHISNQRLQKELAVTRIAIIGDIHTHWNQQDVIFFNQSDYDLLLFVGDLPHLRSMKFNFMELAKGIGQLEKPAFLIPGNHDCTHPVQHLGEIVGKPIMNTLFASRQLRKHQALQKALKGVTVCGYSQHLCTFGDCHFTLIAARPHAIGGSRMSFISYLKKQFGIHSLEDSTQRLKRLIDEAKSQDLVFLAHNGPFGLGAAANDIWGADFGSGGDFGDRDLRDAIEYARASGKQVRAVFAGHMHDIIKAKARSRSTGPRPAERIRFVKEQETYLINPAKVPRISRSSGELRHHHVSLVLGPDDCVIQEVFVANGQIVLTESPTFHQRSFTPRES